MAFDLTPPEPAVGEHAPTRPAGHARHVLLGVHRPRPAAVLEVDERRRRHVEAVTHHAGDAPDLMMDDGIRAIWAAIAEDARGPGVHIMTGPIDVRGAEPGDTLAVRILDMKPRLPYGSNCAANWGLLYTKFGKERITIYGLDETATAVAEFGATASPLFGFDFTARPLYDLPGVISPSPIPRPASRSPARCGAGAAALRGDGRGAGRAGSPVVVPPGVFGGNVDNWRVGPGRHDALSGVRRRRQPLRRRPAFRAGRRRDLRHGDRGVADATIQVFVVEGPRRHGAAARDRHALVHARLRRRSRRGDGDGGRADAVVAAGRTSASAPTTRTRWRRSPSTSASRRWSTARSAATPAIARLDPSADPGRSSARTSTCYGQTISPNGDAPIASRRRGSRPCRSRG